MSRLSQVPAALRPRQAPLEGGAPAAPDAPALVTYGVVGRSTKAVWNPSGMKFFGDVASTSVKRRSREVVSS